MSKVYRRCQVALPDADGFNVWVEADFHCWGYKCHSEKEKKSLTPVTVGIVELDSGEVKRVPPPKVRFFKKEYR
jgi:hypothetical protein